MHPGCAEFAAAAVHNNEGYNDLQHENKVPDVFNERSGVGLDLGDHSRAVRWQPLSDPPHART